MDAARSRGDVIFTYADGEVMVTRRFKKAVIFVSESKFQVERLSLLFVLYIFFKVILFTSFFFGGGGRCG